jgi:hypothetical protein
VPARRPHAGCARAGCGLRAGRGTGEAEIETFLEGIDERMFEEAEDGLEPL